MSFSNVLSETFLLPRNPTDVSSLAGAAKRFSLSHRMGEGRGEGKDVGKPNALQNSRTVPLTLNPHCR